MSISEAGTSMIYTSTVLFIGFVIFAFSEFGGTKALGLLMSVSLAIAMFTNLILLPSLIITFDKGKYKKNQAIIEDYDEFYLENEDQEIDLDLLEIKRNFEQSNDSREV
jgi:predicted RND superfamily exporter protein